MTFEEFTTHLDALTFVVALAMLIVGIPASIAYGIWRMCGKDEYSVTQKGYFTFEDKGDEP